MRFVELVKIPWFVGELVGRVSTYQWADPATQVSTGVSTILGL
jgi:hypothetical protein